MARIVETIDLPSAGRIYPIDKLTLQSMTVNEEKLIYGSSSNVVDKILKACIVDDINIDSLITPDKHYALIRLRVLTYGDQYPVEITCPRCGKRISHIVSLGDLDVDELPKDFKEPIEITLPQSKDILHLQIPRGEKLNRYEALAEKKADKLNEDLSEVNYVFTLMSSITSINDDSMLIDDELYRYVNELSAVDASYIKHTLNKIKVGYDMRISTECTQCGHKFHFTLPIGPDFFRASFDD